MRAVLSPMGSTGHRGTEALGWGLIPIKGEHRWEPLGTQVRMLSDPVCCLTLLSLLLSVPTSVNPSEAPPTLTFQSTAPPFRHCSNAGQVLNINPFPCSNLFPVWTVLPPVFPPSLPGLSAAWQASKGAWAPRADWLSSSLDLPLRDAAPPQSPACICWWGRGGVLNMSRIWCPPSR